jgi:hypothetical protein
VTSHRPARLTGTRVRNILQAAGFLPFIPRVAAHTETARRTGAPTVQRTELLGSFKIRAALDADTIHVRAMRTHSREHREATLNDYRAALMEAGVTNTSIRWVDDEEPTDHSVNPRQHRVLIVPRDQPERAIYGNRKPPEKKQAKPLDTPPAGVI